MSIERVQRDGGVVWRVRWRDGDRNRSKVLGRKKDAEAFDAEIKRRKRTGEFSAVDAGKQTLAEFAEEWWRVHAVPNLSRRTREVYASLWDLHVLPRIGGLQLRELNVETAQRFAADLAVAGVGPASRRKTLRARRRGAPAGRRVGRIPSNPMRAVRKPPARAERRVRPIPPATVEAMRALLLADGRQRDAALVCVLAYAGLRPGEALALRWRDVRERTLLIEKALADGETKPTKTGQLRAVHLLRPLKDDLDLWRLTSTSTDDELVFPTATGGPSATTTGATGAPRLRARRQGGRPRALTPVRPTPLVREPADPRRPQRGRGRRPGRPRTDDDAEHLRPRDRRARRRRTRSRGNADPHCAPRARTRFVPRRAARTQARPRNPCTREEPSSGLEPETPSLPWKCSTN